jgi:quinol monooxygenase YgiN
MENSQPVIAIISFRPIPGFQNTWLEAWKEVRDAALTEPSCRWFHLLHDRNNEAHYAVLTEWDRASDFDAFIRKASVIWLERCLDGTSEPLSYSVFEAIPLETNSSLNPSCSS